MFFLYFSISILQYYTLPSENAANMNTRDLEGQAASGGQSAEPASSIGRLVCRAGKQHREASLQGDHHLCCISLFQSGISLFIMQQQIIYYRCLKDARIRTNTTGKWMVTSCPGSAWCVELYTSTSLGEIRVSRHLCRHSDPPSESLNLNVKP